MDWTLPIDPYTQRVIERLKYEPDLMDDALWADIISGYRAYNLGWRWLFRSGGCE